MALVTVGNSLRRIAKCNSLLQKFGKVVKPRCISHANVSSVESKCLNFLNQHVFLKKLLIQDAFASKRHLLNAQTLTFATYSENQLKKTVDDISEKFSEAISLLDDARNSLGTTYFSADMKDAEDMVNETLKDYEDLLGKLEETQKKTVMRSIGLKMQELKAQMQIVKESVRD